MPDNTLRLNKQTQIFVESPRAPRSDTLDRYTYSIDQLEEFAAHPSAITDLELAQEVADWLERGIAAVDAQIDRAQLIEGSQLDDSDWLHRATYARSIKRSRLKRIERRIGQLDNSTAERMQKAREAVEAARTAAREARTARASPNAMANVEAARIAAANRLERSERRASEARSRAQMFVDVARDMLGPNQVMEIWRRVDERLMKSQDRPSAAAVGDKLEDTGVVAQPKAR